MSNPFDCITDFIFVETEIASADVILIPGASQPQLMEQAAFLYQQGFAKYILPSGGATPKLKTAIFLLKGGLLFFSVYIVKEKKVIRP